MKRFRLGLICLAAGLAALSACTPPKYVRYWSVWRDWQAFVPWGWTIRTEQEGTHYTRTDFNGPYAPEFYLGVPTISVRWHEYKTSHRLPDGLIEYYKDADDYIVQTLKNVYGPHCADFWDERTPPGNLPAADEDGLSRPCGLVDKQKKDEPMAVKGRPDSIYIGDGQKARHFTVLSPVVVPDDGKAFGISFDQKTSQHFVVRMHEYAVLPLKKGFYVIVYPATKSGYDLFKPAFNEFLGSFKVRTEGPGGASQTAPSK